MKRIIEQIVREALPKSFKGSVQISAPDVLEHGHYATNIAFDLGKDLKKNPREIAEDLIQKIKKSKNQKSEDVFEKVEVAGGGFINFWLSDEALFKQLGKVLARPDRWGRSTTGKGKKVRIEYFQPNAAKVPHVGHLRSAVIGDALKRVFLSQGYKVVSDTHIGDWGTQFGILLSAWKSISKKEQDKIKKDPVQGLNDLYVSWNKKIEDDPDLRDKGKEEFAKLEQGDKENRKLWEWMVEVSMKEFEEIMGRLTLLSFEEHRGESVYEDVMPPLVARALKEGVAIEKDGAVIVDLEDEELGDAVLQKSDGASTYLLRDLATLQYCEKKKLEKNLYVVDVRQSHHFKQVFEVGKRLGISIAERSYHVVFGFLSLPQGAMSTRKGNVLGLLDVLDDVEARAGEVIEEKNPDLKKKRQVAQAVGVGALKYFDLSHHPKSNIIFDKEKSLSFEGGTGPYLQYAYARLRSILRRSKKKELRIKKNIEISEVERLLLVETLRFPEVVEDVLGTLAPNGLATYLHGFAQRVSEFYHAVPVLKEEDDEKRGFRLALVEAVAVTLKEGLDLLGIEAPEEM